MSISQRNTKGFSLIEMVIVITIISSITIALVRFSSLQMDQARRQRVATQIQAIINAAVAYYVENGKWPIAAACPGGDNFNTGNQMLQTGGYLPAVSMMNPWGGSYSLMCDANNNATVSTSTQLDSVSGPIIAGMLPMASISNGAAPNTVITVYIPTPAQNLNNARSANFAGIYNSSQCVPVPTCPHGMTAEIMVAPSAVAGTYDGTTAAYDLDSFQAYTTSDSPAANPGACATGVPYDSCTNLPGYVTGNTYWRVCLDVLTPQGTITPTNNTGNELMGNILALTRCMPAAEPSGSQLGSWH